MTHKPLILAGFLGLTLAASCGVVLAPAKMVVGAGVGAVGGAVDAVTRGPSLP